MTPYGNPFVVGGYSSLKVKLVPWTVYFATWVSETPASVTWELIPSREMDTIRTNADVAGESSHLGAISPGGGMTSHRPSLILHSLQCKCDYFYTYSFLYGQLLEFWTKHIMNYSSVYSSLAIFNNLNKNWLSG